MKSGRLFLTLLASVTVFAFTNQVVFALEIPKPQGYLSDYADVFNQRQDLKLSLESKLKNLSQDKQAEVAVLIIKNLEDSSVDTYALDVFRNWGVGDKRTNRGVLFLVSLEDKRARIEVGYGLEGDLTDIESGRILRDIAFPEFEKGDFAGGVEKVVDAIALSIEPGEQLPKTNSDKNSNLFGLVIFAIIIVFQFLILVFAPSKSYWQGGVFGVVGGGLVGFFVFSSWFWAILGASLGGVTLLFFDYLVSKLYAKGWFKKRGTAGFWGGGGGFGGGGSGGGGGFGGFGGGFSGGGGSSGGWR